ncbi:uncharacterized protein LOC127251009 [Andrographis paniculata]|uniref:uncharacterized protein LOC127251009 n=1 Tax=Andrographis paniculata TaxID=175694 RepID=UPI0021E8321B|nr:uncharacterized protein LOC127251009 [Andrographis paniculata]XP_051130489.1 uncharacterized protein LOC127251009 [Andrographis paniculata]XP_051130490.1 uncharacterized protein LOC127251009 [Andrographis paniculata]
MASSAKLSFVLFFACALFVNGTRATEDVICEKLPRSLCAFAVSSSGKRCALAYNSSIVYECKTSEIASNALIGHIETSQCLQSCGMDRQSDGMSSEPQEFVARLCSPACFNNCPNVIDLFSYLAAGEGTSLPAMCTVLAMPPVSSRRAALGVVSAPASSPAYV